MILNPLISIILPVYNRENTISYCMNSLINQSYKNIEIIVIDDHSYDDTIKIVKDFLDHRIKIVTNSFNRGAQFCRNLGIKMATGNWIAFMDSDDIWISDKLKIQVEYLSKYCFEQNILIYCDAIKYDIILNKYEFMKRPIFNGKNVFKELLIKSPPLFPTILTSKAAIESIGYLDEDVPSHQEWDTCISLSKICEFIHVPKVLFIYVIHKENSISKSNKRNIEGGIYIIQKYKADFIEQYGEKYFNKVLFKQLKKALLLNEISLFNSLFKKYFNKINFLSLSLLLIKTSLVFYKKLIMSIKHTDES